MRMPVYHQSPINQQADSFSASDTDSEGEEDSFSWNNTEHDPHDQQGPTENRQGEWTPWINIFIIIITDESAMAKESSVSLMSHDPNDLGLSMLIQIIQRRTHP